VACIYTAKYLISGDGPPLVGGALRDAAGRIAEVGPLAEVRRGNEQLRVVDFGEAILLPPLVNAHTHLELTDFPRWAGRGEERREPADFVDWMLQVIRVKHAVPRENYLPSLCRGIELSLAAGTGAVGDIVSQLPARKAYRGSPLRGRIYLETLGLDPDFTRNALQAIEAVLDQQTVGTMQLGLAPHSPYTLSGEYLEQLYRKCREQALFCTTHVAESKDEVDFLQRHGGAIGTKLYPFVGWQDRLGAAPGLRPIDYLQEQGGLQPHNLLVHAVQLSRGEIDKVAAAGCPVVLCPRSNARLDVGTAPLRELLAAGVTLALGTDSLASCDSLSVWDELAFAATRFAGQVDAPTLLRMATAGGAEALGLGKELGLLRRGYRSSFQVLRPKRLPNRSELSDYLTSAGRSEEVEQLCLDGSPVLPEAM
jgi:cytosine/adenosine deaminase-related metal-dependent hydrolase